MEGYEVLKKRYSLPEIDELEREFEVDKGEKYILREIRKKMTEKVDNLAVILDGVLQPDASRTSEMYEVNYFEDNEKCDVLGLYKRLMWFYRYSGEVALTSTEEAEADFINKFWKEWGDIKDKMRMVIKEMKNCWEKESQSECDLRYLG